MLKVPPPLRLFGRRSFVRRQLHEQWRDRWRSPLQAVPGFVNVSRFYDLSQVHLPVNPFTRPYTSRFSPGLTLLDCRKIARIRAQASTISLKAQHLLLMHQCNIVSCVSATSQVIVAPEAVVL
jgi:hypothetical protein